MLNQYADDNVAYDGNDAAKDSGSEFDGKKIAIFVSGLLLLIIALVAIFYVFNGSRDDNPSIPKEKCGDGACEKNENCVSCIKDCACPDNQECSKEKRRCVDKENSTPEPKKAYCGDGACDAGEGCDNCLKDCPCADNEYCLFDENKCVKYECGDGKCDPFENSMSCCDDCPCTVNGELCNLQAHVCYMPEPVLSQDRAEGLLREYYQNEDKTITEIIKHKIVMVDGKYVRWVQYFVEGEGRKIAVVSDDEVVDVLPTA